MGGEEFTGIIYQDSKNPDAFKNVMSMAQRIRRLISGIKIKTPSGDWYSPTVSVGVRFVSQEDAQAAAEDNDFETSSQGRGYDGRFKKKLLVEADEAMYLAKRGVDKANPDPDGRNRVWVYGQDQPLPRD